MSVKSAIAADKQGNKVIAQTLEKSNTLAQGTHAAAVRWMERMLKLAGFNPGKEDRSFDGATARALKQFQAARGRPATGLLDTKTFEHLKAVQSRVRAHSEKRRPKYFGVGEKDGFIKKAEGQLRKLGYDTGKVDGILDKQTAAAIRAFRKDQRMKGGGVLTSRLEQELAKETKALSHAVYRGRTGADIAHHKRLDAATAKAAAKTTKLPQLNADGTPKLDENGEPLFTTLEGIGRGDKGEAVKNLQWHLRAAGFDPKHLDGVFDERTEAALKAFQRRSGLEPTGRVGPQTWKKLSRTVIYSKKDASPAQKLNEKSSAVLRSEKLLKKLGLNPGKVDGIFDEKTRAAAKKFERQQHLKANGAIEAGQLERMKKAAKGVTPTQLRRIMPNLSMTKARHYAPLITRAMNEAHINTRRRKAMFLAQLAHESGGLRWFEELASGAEYEGRRDLGNTHPGDGRRYKGRGPIQLTGRANYRAAGKALHLPLEAKPKLAARPSVGFRVAAWFWKTRGLNKYADAGNFREVTRRINGGYNGLSSRLAYYRRALKAL
ncbi:MAG: peptidoglycan-binding protein [Myxococcaceae bacterium]|nr:peptidoglycan-binding protein [Myxococcaceae bacterium]